MADVSKAGRVWLLKAWRSSGNTSAGVLGRNIGSWREIGHDSNSIVLSPCTLRRIQVGEGWVGEENGQRALRILLADQDPGALKVTARQAPTRSHADRDRRQPERSCRSRSPARTPSCRWSSSTTTTSTRWTSSRRSARSRAGRSSRCWRRRTRTSCARAAERGIYAARRATATRTRCRARSRSRCAGTPRPTRLAEQVDRLESALERRAVIERAKGILMERHGLDRPRGVRPAARPTRAPTTGRSSTWLAAVTEGHGLLGTTGDGDGRFVEPAGRVAWSVALPGERC